MGEGAFDFEQGLIFYHQPQTPPLNRTPDLGEVREGAAHPTVNHHLPLGVILFNLFFLRNAGLSLITLNRQNYTRA